MTSANLVKVTDASQPQDVRGALRQATAVLHARVDTALPLARPDPSLADYLLHLQLLLRWTRSLPRLPAITGRLDKQAALLQADIAICERLIEDGRHVDDDRHVGPRDGDDAVQPASADAMPADASYAWGMAYVIEGSQLGGQVLYRQLAAALAPHPLDYLRGSGRDTGPRWTAFLGELRSHVRTGHDIEQACRGAVEAFELLLSCHQRSMGVSA